MFFGSQFIGILVSPFASDFGDIFDVDHFINSLRDEVKIVRTLPQKIKRRGYREPLSMQPISWSSEKYYLRQVLTHLLFCKAQY